jgi:hypothetical protein
VRRILRLVLHGRPLLCVALTWVFGRAKKHLGEKVAISVH